MYSVSDNSKKFEGIEKSFDSLNELNFFSGTSLDITGMPEWLPKAVFSRTQNDLIAISENGDRLNFVDYFTNFNLPSILTKNGLLLKGSLLESLAGPLAKGKYVQASEGGALSIGEVSNVSGTVTATRFTDLL